MGSFLWGRMDLDSSPSLSARPKPLLQGKVYKDYGPNSVAAAKLCAHRRLRYCRDTLDGRTCVSWFVFWMSES